MQLMLGKVIFELKNMRNSAIKVDAILKMSVINSGFRLKDGFAITAVTFDSLEFNDNLTQFDLLKKIQIESNSLRTNNLGENVGKEFFFSTVKQSQDELKMLHSIIREVDL